MKYQSRDERKEKRVKEERLDSKNEWNNNDPTPKQAVDNIINKSRASV